MKPRPIIPVHFPSCRGGEWGGVLCGVYLITIVAVAAIRVLCNDNCN